MALEGPDPTLGVFRWSWRRWPQHVTGLIGVAIITVIGAVVGAFANHPPNPTAAQQLAGAGEAAGMTLGGLVVLAFLYAVILAPYEQRNALRRRVAELEEERRAPRRATQAALDELTELLADGDVYLTELRTLAESLPPRDEYETLGSEAKARFESTRAELNAAEEALSEWSVRCPKEVGRLLGSSYAVILGATVDMSAAMDAAPPRLHGWSPFWAHARWQYEELKKMIERHQLP